MRQLYSDRTIDGIGFSKNGLAALCRGEKPLRMWDVGIKCLSPTCNHHIEVKVGRTYNRPLVMFYKLKREVNK